MTTKFPAETSPLVYPLLQHTQVRTPFLISFFKVILERV